jgi:hypothetical protein
MIREGIGGLLVRCLRPQNASHCCSLCLAVSEVSVPGQRSFQTFRFWTDSESFSVPNFLRSVFTWLYHEIADLQLNPVSKNDHITLLAPVHTRMTSPVLTIDAHIFLCAPLPSRPGSSGSSSLGGNPSNSCPRQWEPPRFGPVDVWPSRSPATLHTHVHHSQCRSVRDSEAGGGTGQADGRESAGGFQ